VLDPSFICSQNYGGKLWNGVSLIPRRVYNNCGVVRSMGETVGKMKVVVVYLSCSAMKMVGINGVLKTLI
jgi:hypothetical protein